jgi:hypothetical protein
VGTPIEPSQEKTYKTFQSLSDETINMLNVGPTLQHPSFERTFSNPVQALPQMAPTRNMINTSHPINRQYNSSQEVSDKYSAVDPMSFQSVSETIVRDPTPDMIKDQTAPEMSKKSTLRDIGVKQSARKSQKKPSMDSIDIIQVKDSPPVTSRIGGWRGMASSAEVS